MTAFRLIRVLDVLYEQAVIAHVWAHLEASDVSRDLLQ